MKYVALGFVFTMVTGCGQFFNHKKDSNNPGTISTADGSLAECVPAKTFKDVQSSFTNHCTSCHNSKNASGNIEFETQGELKKWKSALSAIRTGQMPPSGTTLDSCQIANLASYIENTELGQSDSGPCSVPTSVSFAEHVSPILNAYCVNCHQSNGRLRLDRLEDPDDLRDYNQRWALVSKAIGNGSMPPDRELTSCEKKIFSTWYDGKEAPSAGTAMEIFANSSWKSRLSKDEVQNLIKDTFGNQFVDMNLLKKIAILDGSVQEPTLFIGTSSPITNVDLFALNQISQEIGQKIVSNENLGQIDSCFIISPDKSCFYRGATKILNLLWRSINPQEEVDSILDLIWDESDLASSMKKIILVAIQSPYFLYKIENSKDLTNSQILNRISFAIWRSGPSENLLRDISSLNLKDTKELRTIVNSMLADEKASRSFQFILGNMFESKGLSRRDHPGFFYGGLDPTGLEENTKQSMAHFIDYVAFRGRGSFQDLLTSKVIFADTENVATIYGIPKSKEPQVFPQRPGILTRIEFLYQPGLYTSPIQRGHSIRTKVLCDEIILSKIPVNPIPPSVGSDTLSNRETWTRYTADPVCYSCHKGMNSLGFSLEKFDTLGRFRDIEKHYDGTGNVVRDFEIDAGVTPFINPFETDFVSDQNEMVNLIANSEKYFTCMNRQLYRFIFEQRETSASRMMIERYLNGERKSVQDPIIDIFRDFMLRPEFIEVRR